MKRQFTFKVFVRDVAVALVPPIVVLSVHLFRHQIWPGLPQLDVLAHFLGGVAIAWTAMLLWRSWTAQGFIPSSCPWWLRDFTVWGTVAIAGIFWEFYEWTMDHYFFTVMQPSLTDTMHDFLMDLSGGLLFLVVYSLVSRKKA